MKAQTIQDAMSSRLEQTGTTIAQTQMSGCEPSVERPKSYWAMICLPSVYEKSAPSTMAGGRTVV
jgi:hypothetical protein